MSRHVWRKRDLFEGTEESLNASRRPGTHLAAFSSVDKRPDSPPLSALRVEAARRLATTGTHLKEAKRKGT
jgi:hypothetical protein